jgi:ABC-type glycerol-3-phosphate transport system substrate-binding protein
MPGRTLSRRKFLAQTAALTASATIAAPYVHGATAGGKLSCGFWDHWVPSANEPMRQLCMEWAAKEKVDLSVDFITSVGDKLLMTLSAEAQAKTGHDILSFQLWYAAGQAENLTPVDDVMAALISENGKVDASAEYLGKQEGRWIAVPGTWGNSNFPCVARIDLMKQHCGIDLVKMYPAGGPADPALADAWTYDAFLKAAEQCHKAGVPFGMPMSDATDASNWVGAMFAAYGAEMVDKDGNITVKSEPMKQVLEWFKRFVQFVPQEVWAWDNAGNNKWFVSGKGALIMNPPSAWAVAKRDAPKIAEQTWHFPGPKGPKGRFVAASNFFWGAWEFSKNKSAAKSLMYFLGQRPQAEKLVAASQGFDLASFEKQHDFKTWAEQEPPAGTLYHYPPRGDVIGSTCGAPAPTRIGTQMFVHGTMTKMINQATIGGKSIAQATNWAASELEGFMRT